MDPLKKFNTSRATCIWTICWPLIFETKKDIIYIVWPDLAKFVHLGKTSKVFGYSLRVYFVLGKILTLSGQTFMILDKFPLLLMAQYWKDNLATWSHCKTTLKGYVPISSMRTIRPLSNKKVNTDFGHMLNPF